MPCTRPRQSYQNIGHPLPSGGISTNNFTDDDALEECVPDMQVEPEPVTHTEGPLSLNTRVEYSALPAGQTQDVFGLITVQAMTVSQPTADMNATERQAMDIICVLDVSGSMQGDKINQVQDATR